VFYLTHRMLHQPTLYKRVHAIHHEFSAPVGAAALYSHWLEHLVSNLLPVALGPVVMVRTHHLILVISV
jgi:fatty acid hydroxylase domain-containing protein 2